MPSLFRLHASLIHITIFSVILLSLTSIAQAQEAGRGSWQCAHDSAKPVKIPKPPGEHRIDEDSKSFARGDIQMILAHGRDGPFVWAHLHAVHNDRQGETQYRVSGLVLDKEYKQSYLVIPRKNTKAKGVWDKADRHKHCFGTFSFPSGKAPDSDTAEHLSIRVGGVRKNGGFLSGDLPEEVKSRFEQYVLGKIGMSEFTGGL